MPLYCWFINVEHHVLNSIHEPVCTVSPLIPCSGSCSRLGFRLRKKKQNSFMDTCRKSHFKNSCHIKRKRCFSQKLAGELEAMHNRLGFCLRENSCLQVPA